MFQLRPYQAEAKQAILAAWDEGYRKTLLVLPTGCGKTVVFSSVTEDQAKKGHRVLIMAHRGELLDQAADKLRIASGLDSVLEKAESSCLGSTLPVTVGSVQSLSQEKRLARFPNDYFQDIIVDEAHQRIVFCSSASPLYFSLVRMLLTVEVCQFFFPAGVGIPSSVSIFAIACAVFPDINRS